MIELEEQDQYKEDWLGLKTMDKAEKLKFEVMEGEHVSLASPLRLFLAFPTIYKACMQIGDISTSN